MNDEERKAMDAAWREWHYESCVDFCPSVSMTFRKGFDAALNFSRQKLSDAVLAEREACVAVISDYAEKNRDILCREKKWSYTKQLASMIRERGKP